MEATITKVSQEQTPESKMTAFQLSILQNARYAHYLKAITDEQLQNFVDNINNMNEEEHSYELQRLAEAWENADERNRQQESELYEQKIREAMLKQEEQAAYAKRKRVSCPPAIHFKLWEAVKRARAIKAISNESVRYCRKLMIGASDAVLQDLLNQTEGFILARETRLAEAKEAMRKRNKRVSCPPNMAFKLWKAVKKARQMRLITNAQVREYREIRNYGDKMDVSDKALDLMELMLHKSSLEALKSSLMQRQEERVSRKLTTDRFMKANPTATNRSAA